MTEQTQPEDQRPPEDQTQRDLIRDAHGRTLFVEAGAGTGKTTALVQRVVHMVATGHLQEMSALAAITFTENAAAELRTRIREALEEALGDNTPYDETQQSRCRTALASLDEATISTLHGFSARILSEMPLEAGLPPGFSVSDPITAQIEGGRAWGDFVDDLLDDVEVHDHVVAGLTLGLTLGRLRATAAEFSSHWDELLGKPFAHRSFPDLDVSPVLDGLHEALESLSDAPDDDRLTTYLTSFVQPLSEELSALTDRIDLIEAMHQAKQLDRRTFPSNKKTWEQHGGKERVSVPLERARDARAALLAQVSGAVTEALCARLQDFVLMEAKRRQREGRLEFHDLLVLTRDVLRGNAEVRSRMHDRFRVILVDEFQDTDPLQVEIVCLIAGDCGDKPPAAWADIPVADGRLFFVGDPKQSIYRFRRADVQIYQQVGKLHAAGGTSLQVNFRSVPGVVRPVNKLFGALMDVAEGQVTYADLKWHRTEDAGGGRPVRLLGGPQAGAKAAQLREQEAAHIAATVSRAMSEQWLVTRNRGGQQALRYADVAVLLPTRTSLPALEEALKHAEIPYRVESRSLVWGTDAVRDVVTILQALANPADEVAIVAALRHHGLACSDDHLTEWAAAGGRWSYLARTPEGFATDHPVVEGLAQLRRWHDLRWWVPVNQLVDRVVRELRLVELTAELPRPRDHWRRLRFIVDQARAFCDAGGTGLAEFVTWAASQIDSEADVLETAVPEPDDDSVRILTVHGSKGLEFPLTILGGLSVPPRSLTEVVWGGKRPEARLKSDALETDGFATRKAEEKDRDLAEAIRLLYVAMTRAQDHLVVSCYHSPPKGKGALLSHAQLVWDHLGQSDLVTVESEAPEAPSDPAPLVLPLAAAAPDDRDAAMETREAMLTAVRARVAATATSLVAEAQQTAAEGTVPLPQSASAPPLAPGKGAALGSAVHGVLELVDLAMSSKAEVQALADLLCEELGIPDLAGEVHARVERALTSKQVAAAGTSGRFWREVFVVAQDGERYVEGFVDLLVEDEDGLRVVDYKTDHARTDDERALKTKHYQPQLQAYAAALSRVPGVDVRRGSLLFVGRDDAVDGDVPLAVMEGPTS
ncbi:UvrD-helicase domain-containing protein [Nocardioides pacificus]